MRGSRLRRKHDRSPRLQRHTTLPTEDARGECTYDIAEISRDRAEPIMADLAHRYWPAHAAQLHWVANAYPT